MKTSKFSQKSYLYLALSLAIILGVHFLYYPKWKEQRTQATLSWDTSGYYMYLPATFIYKDLKKCGFKDKIISEYYPSPDFQQAFIHKESGNYVMKYSMGQAIQFAPFFGIAHLWASNSDSYKADGFSLPYQFMISMGSIFFTIIGLFLIYKSLLYYFEDDAIGWTILSLILGSNYLIYAAISNSMTHNHLFTIYAALIYASINFYKKPTYLKATIIGILVGIGALTRPTEIIGALIPLLWGVTSIKSLFGDRISFVLDHWKKYALAALITLFIGSWQLMYWKYVSGDWIVYSYEDQGFSWLRPHLLDGLFSYRSGWLVYSPFMIFSIIGFYFLYKKAPSTFIVTLVFTILFIYIAFAWDIWWYGGSVGQRTMVQAYAILSFPLAAFFDWFIKSRRIWKLLLIPLIGMLFYFNVWVTHQAHKGGLLYPGNMTRTYFWKIIGTYKEDITNRKFLDTNDHYEGELIDPDTLINVDYNHTIGSDYHLSSQHEFTPELIANLSEDNNWVRAYATVTQHQKQWDTWKMAQFTVKYLYNGQAVKTRSIRPQRMMSNDETRMIFFDTERPDNANQVQLYIWNAGSNIPIDIKNLMLIAYQEE